MRLIAALPLVLLAACKPPAADDYVERVEIGASQDMPSAPLESPDTDGALWADSDRPLRLVYGKPGETPLLALACERAESSSMIRLTRFAPADPQAQALIALIGNGHMTRLPIDAKWNGRFWLWEMELAADDPALDVLTGPRKVELTIPGAGSVNLNPSQRPGQLIEGCRLPEQPLPPQE